MSAPDAVRGRLTAGPSPTFSPTLAAVAATVVAVLPVLLTGALAVQIRRTFPLDPAHLSFVISAGFAASAASAMTSGRLSDRRGSRWPVRIGVLLNAGALFAIGTIVRSWVGLAVALVAAGAGNGMIQPATNRLIARRVRQGRQGWSYGVKQAAIPIATLSGGLAVPVVALTVGWQWAFVGCGLAALVVLALLPGDGPPVRQEQVDGGRLFAGPLLVLMVASGLGAAAANGMGAFMAVAAVGDGISQAGAGLLIALGAVMSLVARLLVGWHADRTGRDGFGLVAAMLAAGGVGYGLLATGWIPLVLVGTVLAFGAGWGWAGLLNYTIVRSYPHAPAAATGMTQGAAYLGGVVGPTAFGLAGTHLTLAVAWWGAGLAVLLAALCALLGRSLMAARRGPDDGVPSL
jgi:MFS family permease